MGAAAVVGFKLNEKYYLSYTHFDGHPHIAGVAAAELICETIRKGSLESLKQSVSNIRLIDEMQA